MPWKSVKKLARKCSKFSIAQQHEMIGVWSCSTAEYWELPNRNASAICNKYTMLYKHQSTWKEQWLNLDIHISCIVLTFGNEIFLPHFLTCKMGLKGPLRKSILKMTSLLLTKHSDILGKTILKLIRYLIIFGLIQNLDNKPK